jgi:hypothetical protein
MIRLFAIVTLGLCTVFGTGCGGAGDPPPPMPSVDTADTKPMPSAIEVCQNHEEGCPCDEPGTTTDCGQIKRVEGNYVWCSTGTQTCTEDGEWGKCTGATIDMSKAP